MISDIRWSILVASVLAIWPGAVEGQSRPFDAKERAKLLAAREQVWLAWFNNDQARLSELLPQRVIAINYGDTTWYDRAGVLRSAADFSQSGTKLIGVSFPRTEIQTFGDVAVLFSLFRVETESNGKRTVDSGRATEVFVLRDGKWVNPSWHLDSGR
jgi:hypothetical protein